MSTPAILIIRFFTSVLVALFISFFFFQEKSVVLVIGLALALFALAYVFEYAQKRNKNE
jgi:LPS O-antigen subunit length determinant protein (WzzB/FepE family)